MEKKYIFDSWVKFYFFLLHLSALIFAPKWMRLIWDMFFLYMGTQIISNLIDKFF